MKAIIIKSVPVLIVILGLSALGISIRFAVQFLSAQNTGLVEWASAAFVLLMGLAVMIGAIWLARKRRAKAK